MNDITALREVFAGRRYRVAAAGLAAVLIPLLAITSNILSPDGLSINPFAEPLGVVIMAAIAAAMAVNGAILLRNYDLRAALPGKAAAAGGGAALLASACPYCQPVWLVWLGLGSATAFLSAIGAYLGLLSLAMLLVSIHYSLKSAKAVCEVA